MLSFRHLFFVSSYLALRRRIRAAARWINKIHSSQWKVVEISGARTCLKSRIFDCQYIRLHESTREVPVADIVVFLGLADRLSAGELCEFLERIQAKRILFSFTEDKPSRSLGGRRRPTRRREKQVKELLLKHGYRRSEIRPLRFPRNERIVLAERSFL